jgi:hypothetical protein
MSRHDPMGQAQPQKTRPRGKVIRIRIRAKRKVPIKALADTIEDIASKGSARKKRSTGILVDKGKPVLRKR